jgi:hypothetical protein
MDTNIVASTAAIMIFFIAGSFSEKLDVVIQKVSCTARQSNYN